VYADRMRSRLCSLRGSRTSSVALALFIVGLLSSDIVLSHPEKSRVVLSS
jgi:hypothetical protein